MRTSLMRYTGRTWRLAASGMTWSNKKSAFVHSTALPTTSTRAAAASSTHSHSYGSGGWRASVRPPRPRRYRKFPMSWLLWPKWLSRRATLLRSATMARVPVPASVSHAVALMDRQVEWLLSLVERPARIGVSGALTTLRIALQLGISVLQLCQEVYLYIFGPRLRRFLRFAIGVPFFVGTWFLLEMKQWYFPEVGTGLDTSCVASLPLCTSVEEAMTTAALLQHRYHKLLSARRAEAEAKAEVSTHPQSRTLIQPLTQDEENELLGAIFVLIRSIETQIVGTVEERELITPRADVATVPKTIVSVAQPAAQPSQPAAAEDEVNTATTAAAVSTTTTAPDQDDTVTATPHIAVSSSSILVPAAAAAEAALPAVMVSPAEYILRVIMAISIAEGWSDITEHTRALFQELVRNKSPPVQSRIVQAVGELCSLSYELESGQVDAITLDQRKRIAAAIDAFRPEKSVEERCTIAHEITILPLPDFDHTTRCLGMIRKSPGRKPQLILCFVGSNSKRNWMTNFNYWPVPLPERYGVQGAPIPRLPGRVAQPQVHRGFLGLVQTVPYKEVAADFDHILLVGHSLGGALAQLAGLELAAERPSRRITVITMASPRVLAVDWRSRLRMVRQQAREYRARQADLQQQTGFPQPKVAPAMPAAAAAAATATPPGDAHERDTLAEMLTTPPNYRHFRGYLQPDVVPHLPPEFLHFTHSGQRIPLNTGCSTSLSFMAWGMYSELYHSSDLYKIVLRQPIVSQTHWYTGDEEEESIDVEEYVQMRV